MRSRDTSEKAAAIELAVLQRLGPERRFRMAMELSDFMHELAKSGIRARHPEYSEEQVVRELARVLYGK